MGCSLEGGRGGKRQSQPLDPRPARAVEMIRDLLIISSTGTAPLSTYCAGLLQRERRTAAVGLSRRQRGRPRRRNMLPPDPGGTQPSNT